MKKATTPKRSASKVTQKTTSKTAPKTDSTPGKLKNSVSDRVQRTLGTGAYARNEDKVLQRETYGRQSQATRDRQAEIGKKLYGPSIFERHEPLRRGFNAANVKRTASKKEVEDAKKFSKGFKGGD